jgi:hypothetical protein
MVKSNHAAVVLTPEGQDRCVRAVIRRIIAVHRRRTPGWARNASIVQLLLEHGEWKSVISGAKTKLTLMQCVAPRGAPQRPWGALNTRVVTMQESKFLLDMVEEETTNWRSANTQQCA